MLKKVKLVILAAFFVFGFTINYYQPTLAVDCADGTAADDIESCPESQTNDCSGINSQNGCAPIERIAIDENLADSSPNETITEPTDEPAIEIARSDQTTISTTQSPDTITENPAERSLWPMYLSLGALGLAVLLIMILNFRGQRNS